MPALSAGEVVSATTMNCGVIPSAWVMGSTYYLGVCVAVTADEFDATNNCSAGVAVQVNSFDWSVPADLIVSEDLGTVGSISLVTTVQNTGAEDASTATLNFHWSEDSSITTTDALLCTTAVMVPPLAAGANSGELSQSCSEPAFLTSGDGYYVGACVAAVATEFDASNNCSTGLAQNIRYFDWIVPDGISVDNTVDNTQPITVGSTVQLAATVQNTGTGQASSTILRFYWSQDAAISIADTPLCPAGVTVPALYTETSSSISQSCQIPPSQTVGTTYYVGACVISSVNEFDDGNNCSTGVSVRTSSFDWVITGDLSVDNMVDSNASISIGATVQLATTVQNMMGTGEAFPTTLRFYWSEDADITTTDTPLCSAGVTVPALAAGANSGSLGQNCSVPQSQTAGTTYYVGACVATLPHELNASNNCSGGVAVSIAVSYFDFSVLGTISVSPTMVEFGDTMSLDATVQNTGTGAASATTLRFYWSENSTIATTDTPLCTAGVAVPALAAAANSGDLNQSCPIPTAQTAGITYYVGACVATIANEEDAENNCSTGLSVTLNGADWIVNQLGVDDNTVDADATIAFDATVQNTGMGEAAATTLRFYWSDDSSITTTDTPLCTAGIAVPALAVAANSGRLSQSCPIPTAQTIGTTYYVGACVATAANEEDAANNCSTGLAVTLNSADWIVNQPGVDDNTVDSGATITLDTTVQNAGMRAASATTLRFYWSDDSSITTTDTPLCTAGIAVPALAVAANSGSLSQSCPIPTSQTIEATYYVGACVATSAEELNAENNCSTGLAVTINSADLIVSQPGVDDNTVDSDATITLDTTVQNVGMGAASATTLRFYWSDDSSITTTDTLLCTVGVAVPALATAANSGNLSQSCAIPTAQTIGATYYVGACVATAAEELNAENNCSTGLAVTLNSADWIVSQPGVDDNTVDSDATITLDTTVQNVGMGAASATTLRFYWSDDSSITTTDTLLCTVGVAVPALATAANSGNLSQSCAIPTAQTIGATYYVGACVATAAEELNAANNCSVGISVSINRFDWVVQENSLNINANQLNFGDQITLFATAENAGEGAAIEATTLRFYWSEDSTIATTDTPLCTEGVQVAALAAGLHSASLSQSCPLPSSQSSGVNYYVGACIATTSNEADVENNCSVGVAVSINGFDWVVPLSALSVDPDLVGAGETITLVTTVQNKGEGAAPVTTLRFYWSQDSTISTTDTSLCVAGVSVPTLASRFNSQSLSQSCLVPESLIAGGSYYVGACVVTVSDELDAGNNCSVGVAVSIIGVDLIVLPGATSIDKDTVNSSDTISLATTVQNSGSEMASSTTLRFYWSDDSSITTTDTPLCTASVAVPTLAAGANIGGLTQSCPVPLSQPLGATYYVGACVAVLAKELDTTNNCSAGVAVHINTFDWVVAGTVGITPNMVDQDAMVALAATVQNQGSGAASLTTSLRFYWSDDSSITTTDTPLCTASVTVPALAAGFNSGSLSQNCLVPPSQTIGATYYVGACVATAPDELDAGNNCSVGVAVLINYFDLTVRQPSVGDTTLELDQTFTISTMVENEGTGPAGATTLRFYWSEDTSITTTDTPLCTAGVTVPALAAGSGSNRSQGCTVPPSQTIGATYYVGACVATVGDELNAANNCSDGIAVRINYFDWTVSQPSVGDTTLDLDQTFTISTTVENEGTEPAGATTLRFYWSEDTSITTTDSALCTTGLSVPEIASGSSSSLSQDCAVPASQTTGATYYVGACVGTVTGEFNAANNCSVGMAVSINTFDWTVSQPSVGDTTLEPDQTFTISAMVENEGSGQAGATTLRFYWSEDVSISTTDSALCTAGVAVAALATGGNSSDLSQDCTVPASQTIGATYYVGACVETVVGELNSANNCSDGVAVSINHFDWSVQSAPNVSSNLVGSGETISLNTTVQNSGTGAAPSTTLRFYWSEDTSISTADTPLCQAGVTVPTLVAGSGSGSSSILGPIKTQGGRRCRPGAAILYRCIQRDCLAGTHQIRGDIWSTLHTPIEVVNAHGNPVRAVVSGI